MKSLNELLTASASHVIFSCVAGSRAYGTQIPGSDEDIRGLYVVPSTYYLPLDQSPAQLADERGNTVYYSLRRCIELLTEANPNILELLFTPPDCVISTSPVMENLIQARSMFVTRQCGDTHIGYAMSQIKKARGQNKWVNNPKPPEMPDTRIFRPFSRVLGVYKSTTYSACQPPFPGTSRHNPGTPNLSSTHSWLRERGPPRRHRQCYYPTAFNISQGLCRGTSARPNNCQSRHHERATVPSRDALNGATSR
jgi:hypothetical protein